MDDLLLNSWDFIEEAQAYEYDIKCLLDGSHEAPPWTTVEALVEHYRACAADCRKRATELRAQEVQS